MPEVALNLRESLQCVNHGDRQRLNKVPRLVGSHISKKSLSITTVVDFFVNFAVTISVNKCGHFITQQERKAIIRLS